MGATKQTGWPVKLADNKTDKQTDSPRPKQINRQTAQHPNRQTDRQPKTQTDRQPNRIRQWRKNRQKWRARGFTRWFLSLRKTLTKTGLDSGCKPIGFPSAPLQGLFTFSSSTLVEHGWTQGRLSTFEAAWLPGALALLSSASLAFSGLHQSWSTSYQAKV